MKKATVQCEIIALYGIRNTHVFHLTQTLCNNDIDIVAQTSDKLFFVICMCGFWARDSSLITRTPTVQWGACWISTTNRRWFRFAVGSGSLQLVKLEVFNHKMIGFFFSIFCILFRNCALLARKFFPSRWAESFALEFFLILQLFSMTWWWWLH